VEFEGSHDTEMSKIQISKIHNIEGAGFENKDIVAFDIVQLVDGDLNKGRNTVSHIEQCAEFKTKILACVNSSVNGDKRICKLDVDRAILQKLQVGERYRSTIK